tara:strand:- start:9623 stop:10399 length:777 start_codon:yes stop_codon:yes gene_type:complete
MKIGFIGSGQITKAVVSGIINSKIKITKIYISERNKKVSNYLKSKSKKIKILKKNQDIINKSSWIFLAVTPDVGNKILHKLNYGKNKYIISLISTINLPQLRKITGLDKNIVRAIPLPPISLCKGPVPIFPPNKKIRNFFNNLGSTVEIKNENLSLNFWATSAMMAPFYQILQTLIGWLTHKGIKTRDAQKYITSLFSALAEDAAIYNKDLRNLVKNSQTTGGLNEQALKELRRSGFFKLLLSSSNKILKRLKKSQSN